MYKIICIGITLSFLISFSACEKFLDKKPDLRLAVPQTLRDLQALLDENSRVNADPSSLELSADDYYLTDADWAAVTVETQRRMYLWLPERLFEPLSNDWFNQYRKIYIANTILEALPSIDRSDFNKLEWDNIKGQALYLRGKTFLEIASIWSLAYDSANANTQLGIPLRLTSDFNIPSGRSTLQETYNQVILDLKASLPLLPSTPVHVLRASKPSSYAILARTFLYTQQYQNAGLYADSSLQIRNQLINFNSLSASATFPFPQFNTEVLYASRFNATPLQNTRARIDSVLISTYAANDLRKTLYFRNNGNNTFGFKGSFEGSTVLMHGPTTAEMYLTKAEAFARQDLLPQAMNILNTLLITRWKTNTFTQLTANTKGEALSQILAERRKELVMRGLRWMDLKRLNRINYNIVPKRNINNQVHILLPNDLRYALPIPEDIIDKTGMSQNPR